jgi:hypothetical protein
MVSISSLSPRATALVLLTAFPSVLAYTSSGHPFATHFPRKPFVAGRKRATVTYDLGIGKNQPVGGHTVDDAKDAVATDPYELAKYCSEFEAVNEIPNPVQRLKELQLQHRKEASKPKIQPIVPKRFNRADFSIQKDDGSEALVIMPQEMINHFDVNTAWVEMLIHEQRAKLA